MFGSSRRATRFGWFSRSNEAVAGRPNIFKPKQCRTRAVTQTNVTAQARCLCRAIPDENWCHNITDDKRDFPKLEHQHEWNLDELDQKTEHVWLNSRLKTKPLSGRIQQRNSSGRVNITRIAYRGSITVWRHGSERIWEMTACPMLRYSEWQYGFHYHRACTFAGFPNALSAPVAERPGYAK